MLHYCWCSHTRRPKYARKKFEKINFITWNWEWKLLAKSMEHGDRNGSCDDWWPRFNPIKHRFTIGFVRNFIANSTLMWFSQIPFKDSETESQTASEISESHAAYNNLPFLFPFDRYSWNLPHCLRSQSPGLWKHLHGSGVGRSEFNNTL